MAFTFSRLIAYGVLLICFSSKPPISLLFPLLVKALVFARVWTKRVKHLQPTRPRLTLFRLRHKTSGNLERFRPRPQVLIDSTMPYTFRFGIVFLCDFMIGISDSMRVFVRKDVPSHAIALRPSKSRDSQSLFSTNAVLS